MSTSASSAECRASRSRQHDASATGSISNAVALGFGPAG